MIDYTALPDERINEMIAERVMRWIKADNFIDWCWVDRANLYYPLALVYPRTNTEEFDEIKIWDPVHDFNQCYQAEEEIINNFDRTENMPGAICDWYAVKLRRMLEPMCLSPRSSVLSMNKLERLVIHATARQKCVAMLMAVEDE